MTPTRIASFGRPKTPDELALAVDITIKEQIASLKFPTSGHLQENCVHQLVRHNRSPDFIRQIANVKPLTWENVDKHPFNQKDGSDQKTTPLVLAAALNKTEHAIALVLGGASERMVDIWGRTALHYAVMHGNAALVEVLLADRRPYNIEDAKKLTPLNYLVVPERSKEGLKNYGREFKPFDREEIRELFSKRMSEDKKCRR